MANESERADLMAKLLAAQRSARVVEKAGRNKAQGYNYAQASDVIEEAQRALHEAELVGYVDPDHESIKSREITSSGGGAGMFVTIRVALVIADPDSGAELRVAFTGTGTDYPGDKAIYKALTGAAKYAYASVLGIPFGDDPEEHRDGEPTERRPRSHANEPATGPQKGTITRLLNRAGMESGFQQAVIGGIRAGDKLTKAEASEILDLLAPAADDPAALEAAVDELVERAGVSPPSDIPAADVPPPDPSAGEPASEAGTIGGDEQPELEPAAEQEEGDDGE